MDILDFGFDEGAKSYDTAEDIWGDMANISIFIPDDTENFKIEKGICVLNPVLEYVRNREDEIKQSILNKVKEKFKNNKKLLKSLQNNRNFIDSLYADTLSLEFYDIYDDYDIVLTVKSNEDFVEACISVCIDKELNVTAVQVY